MKSTIQLILSLLLTVYSMPLLSQTGTGRITGGVTDVQNKPLAGATVMLLHARDSGVYKTMVSGEDGRFVFKKLPPAQYILRISSVGFNKYTSSMLTLSETHALIQLPAMVLTAARQPVLQPVTVTAKKPLIEHKPDRVIVNVDAMIGAAGSNALDALGRSPGVNVHFDGDITLNGKGSVLVLIDDRPTYLSATELAAYLRSLPAGLIDKIELISNPPARYDASGGAIINIQLKKNRAPGFNGNVIVGYSQGVYRQNNESLVLNYRRKKINWFTNISHTEDGNYTKDTSRRYYFNSAGADSLSVVINKRYRFRSDGWNIRTGWDYYASATTTLGIMLTGGIRPKTDRQTYSSVQSADGLKPDSTATGFTDGDYQWYNGGINANFLHNMKSPGASISGDLDFVNIHAGGSQLSSTGVYEADGNAGSNTNIMYQLPANINIWSAKTDYMHPLKGKAGIEAGLKSSYVITRYNNDWYNKTGNEYLPDYGKTNHFIYGEQIHALYASAYKEWTRWAMKAGLRMEHTISDGQQPANPVLPDSSFHRQYTTLFPSFYLSYKFSHNDNNTITLSYGKRIRRPNYQQLNPFIFYSDRYSYSAGNPWLNAQLMQAIELNYDHKNLFGLSVFYMYVNRLIQYLVQYTGDVVVTRPQNFGANYSINFRPYISIDPVKGWHVNANSMIFHLVNKGMADEQVIQDAITTFEVEVSNQFQFSRSWSAELGGLYAGTHLSGQTTTRPIWYGYAGIQKLIFKQKGALKLNVNDPFHTRIRRDQVIGMNTIAYRTQETDTQRFGMSFSYRFGKETNNRKRNHTTGGAAEEQGRGN